MKITDEMVVAFAKGAEMGDGQGRFTSDNPAMQRALDGTKRRIINGLEAALSIPASAGEVKGIRNPFKVKLLANQFRACVACYFTRYQDLFRSDGKRHTGNGVANKFWLGFDRAWPAEKWDAASKNSAGYAAYRAGEAIADYEAATRAALPPGAGEVKVKALTWRAYGNQHVSGWQGQGAMGYLCYITDTGPDGEGKDGWWCDGERFDGPDEAKASKQRHYEARIRSALSSAPVTEAEPFAWYWYDKHNCLCIAADSRKPEFPEAVFPLFTSLPPDVRREARDRALGEAARIAYRECAQTRHVRLGNAVSDAILALKAGGK